MYKIYAVDAADPESFRRDERSPHASDNLISALPNPALRSGVLGVLLGSVGAIALVLGAGVSPATSFSFNSRQSAYDLSFSQPDFADALASYRITYTTDAERGELITLDTQLKTSVQNFVGLPSGSNSIASVTQSGNVFTHFIVSNGGPGGFEIRYDTPVATAPGGNFNESWLVRSFDGEAWDLEFLGDGSNTGLIPPDYELAIALPGNWSTQGSNPGQLEFRGIGPGYTILDNFSYNPATNLTTFKAVNHRWDGSSPDLNFVLHGRSPQSTPEPGVLMGLAALLGAIFHWRHLRPSS